jgi:hypothetical protein
MRDFLHINLVCMHNIHSTLNGRHEKLYNCQRMDNLLILINHQVFIYIRVVGHSGYDATTMKPTPVFALSHHHKPPASRKAIAPDWGKSLQSYAANFVLHSTSSNSVAAYETGKNTTKQELPIFFRQIQPQYCKTIQTLSWRQGCWKLGRILALEVANCRSK